MSKRDQVVDTTDYSDATLRRLLLSLFEPQSCFGDGLTLISSNLEKLTLIPSNLDKLTLIPSNLDKLTSIFK